MQQQASDIENSVTQVGLGQSQQSEKDQILSHPGQQTYILTFRGDARAKLGPYLARLS